MRLEGFYALNHEEAATAHMAEAAPKCSCIEGLFSQEKNLPTTVDRTVVSGSFFRSSMNC